MTSSDNKQPSDPEKISENQTYTTETFVLGFFSLLPVFGLGAAIIGLVLGFKTKIRKAEQLGYNDLDRKVKSSDTLTTIGITLCSISVVVHLVVFGGMLLFAIMGSR